MGKRERRRQRGAPREEPLPEPGPRESGLLGGQTCPQMRGQLQSIGEGLRARYGTIAGETAALTRHADHDPSLPCRPALGNGLCYPAPAGAHLVPWREVPGQQER